MMLHTGAWLKIAATSSLKPRRLARLKNMIGKMNSQMVNETQVDDHLTYGDGNQHVTHHQVPCFNWAGLQNTFIE